MTASRKLRDLELVLVKRSSRHPRLCTRETYQRKFPVVLDDLVPADHVCRVIDVFVRQLAIEELGFEADCPYLLHRSEFRNGLEDLHLGSETDNSFRSSHVPSENCFAGWPTRR